MSQKQIKFGKIFSEDDFHYFIKYFSTSGILKSTYKVSKEVYLGGCSIDSLQRHVTERDVKSGQILEQDVLIQPWQFADLIYESIVYSNDYKGAIDLKDNMFLLSLVETGEYVELLTKPMIKELHSEFDISLFMYDFGGEQFKYQTQFVFFQNLIRELYIIFSITKKYPYTIKPEEIVKQEIKVEWKV